MKKQLKLLTIISSTIALLIASENAFSIESSAFKIKTVNSKKAAITNVKLLKINEHYIIKGKVRNKLKSRITPIPGHVDISVVGSNGKTINTSPVAIYRINKRSRFARFKQELKVTPSAGSSIRVAHHNAPLGANTTDIEHL